MSNKTTFKRIALAVVAALGFGVLASAPSQATVQNLAVTVTNGTATLAVQDTTTAGVVLVEGLLDAGIADTITVAVIQKSVPSSSSGVVPLLGYRETTTVASRVDNASPFSAPSSKFDSVTTTGLFSISSETAAYVGARFTVQLETGTGTIVAGTYTYTVVVKPFTAGVEGAAITKDVSIVIAPAATASSVVDPTKTVAVLSDTSGVVATTLTADSSLAVSSTASSTPRGYVRVQTFNAAEGAAPESVTATITGAGILSINGVAASTIKIAGDGDDVFTILSDGRAGIGSIVIATTSKTFPAKTITFYASAPATVTPTVRIPVVGTSEKGALRATALDANGNVWGGQAYLFSQDTAIATAGSCSFNASLGVHDCNVTGVAAGQSSFKIGNASTAAASTVLTDAFNGPRVTLKTAASVKIEFDKAAYAPGEKAIVYVTPLDDAGLGVVGGTLTGMLATGGISSTVAFSSGSDTLTATDLRVAEISSSTTGAKAGSAMYTVYMPFGKGTVTLSATGGTSLPVAGRVAVTASADVVDDSVDAAVDAAQEATDAAIAATDAAILAQEAADEAASAAIAAQETAQAAVDAVTALSAEVTKLVAQLATLQKLLNRVAKKVGLKV